MTEVNANDLVDAGLDWAVAICEKVNITGRDKDGKLLITLGTPSSKQHTYSPSTDNWLGDEIISREGILVTEDQEDVGYQAFRLDDERNVRGSVIGFGKSPLVAAMRCYVASTLGKTILVPDEIAKPLMSPHSGPWGI